MPAFEPCVKTVSLIMPKVLRTCRAPFKDTTAAADPFSPSSPSRPRQAILILEATSRKNSFDQRVRAAGSLTNGSTSFRI